MTGSVRVGVFGTSWWADAMYLPALDLHPDAHLTAVCGRRPETTEAFATRWGADHWFTDPATMLAQADLDAVLVATANDSHHGLVMAALERGLHVLCEKPLALDAGEAAEMATAARKAAVATMVPFTYRWMPMVQWMRRLVADGYVGRPRQLNFRYFSGYGLDGAYAWRFDPAIAGSGVIGDLGSHLIHLARFLIDDDEVGVSALAPRLVERAGRPDGSPYEPLEDTAILTVRYRSGACGVLHASAAAWEGDHEIGQLQAFDIHGDEGTLHGVCDWHHVQEVRGSRLGDGGVPAVLPIPDELWGDVRRAPVPDTYRDVFRTTDAMTRGWIDAIKRGDSIQPDFDEGLAVQHVIDAAVRSAQAGGAEVAVPSA
jgi:predicted dehydrogenase